MVAQANVVRAVHPSLGRPRTLNPDNTETVEPGTIGKTGRRKTLLE
jgi:hypothetical protein